VSDDPKSVPLPDEIPIPLNVLSRVIFASERAIEALQQHGYLERARRLDEAIGALSQEVLRRIGLWDDDE
jgi:hypothetical protein